MLKKRQKPFPAPPWTSCVTSRFYVPPITETTEASFRDGLISNPKKGFGLYFVMTRCQAGYQGLTYRFEVIISPASCITAKENKLKKKSLSCDEAFKYSSISHTEQYWGLFYTSLNTKNAVILLIYLLTLTNLTEGTDGGPLLTNHLGLQCDFVSANWTALDTVNYRTKTFIQY